MSFKDSQKSARQHIDRCVTGSNNYAFRYAVDVRWARIRGVEPLPNFKRPR